MGTLRFFEEVVSFKIRRTFGFADYIRAVRRRRQTQHEPQRIAVRRMGRGGAGNTKQGHPYAKCE